MVVDLQKIAVRRLLDKQSHDLFSKIQTSYFTGANSAIFDKIQSFYKANTKLPSVNEFLVLRKDQLLQDYLENQILDDNNVNDLIGDEFLVAQLQDYFIREETISFLDKFVDNLDNLEKVEIIEEFNDHLLTLNKAMPYDDELFDVAKLDFFSEEETYKLYPSGLSAEFDSVNGGFGTQELVLLGGRRGSGKSILTVNMALTRFFSGNTVALFSIEMRYKEVYDRIMSIISGVPFLDIYKNKTSTEQKITMAKAKFKAFYKPSAEVDDLLKTLELTANFKDFDSKLKIIGPELLDNRLFIIDDESLTLNRIDHYCNMFKNKYPDFTLAAVDYLNIINHEDQKNWQTQIVIADSLKTLARKHDVTILSPYQIDASGEARFAKGILDSADRSFNFFPPPESEDRELESKITVHTTKIRNGRHMSFDVNMNWECVKVDPNMSKVVNEKPHNATKFGTGREYADDI